MVGCNFDSPLNAMSCYTGRTEAKELAVMDGWEQSEVPRANSRVRSRSVRCYQKLPGIRPNASVCSTSSTFPAQSVMFSHAVHY